MVRIKGVELPISLSSDVIGRMFDEDSNPQKALQSFMDSYNEAKLHVGKFQKASDNDIAIARAYIKQGMSMENVAKQFKITPGRVSGAVLRAGREALIQLNK